MINVETLFNRVNKDLATVGQTGYDSNGEFNRSMSEFELILLEYYHKMFEKDQNVADSVNPFVERSDISISSGDVPFPSDYAHRLNMDYRNVTNVSGSEPTVEYIPMNIEKIGENRSSSAIRKPVIGNPKTYSYGQKNGLFYVLPSALTGKVRLTYLRKPVFGVRAVTTGGDDLEVYDSGSSIQLEWPETELPNFVAGLLMMKGVHIRDNDVVQWALANKQAVKDFQ